VEGPLADDLLAEQLVLDAQLASLDDRGWARPTPAEGWTVADTVRHLIIAERAATRSVRDGIDFVVGGDVVGDAGSRSNPPTCSTRGVGLVPRHSTRCGPSQTAHACRGAAVR
jgi:hypothetical protein